MLRVRFNKDSPRVNVIRHEVPVLGLLVGISSDLNISKRE